MSADIVINRADHLLNSQGPDRTTQLVNDAYGWAKPVAVVGGTVLAVGAGLLLLERGVGLAALARGKGLGAIFGGVGAEATGAALNGLRAEATSSALGVIRNEASSALLNGVRNDATNLAISKTSIETLPSLTVNSGALAADGVGLRATTELKSAESLLSRSDLNINTQSFPTMKHRLANDGTFATLYEDSKMIVRKPDGTEIISHVNDPGFRTGRMANGDFFTNGKITVKQTFHPDMLEPQIVSRPTLNPNEILVKPWNSPDGAVTVFKDGSLMTHAPYGETTVRTAFGVEFQRQGLLQSETVLNAGKGIETTYFSSGHVLEVGDNGISKLWTPNHFEKPTPADFFNPQKGGLVTNNWKTGKYTSENTFLTGSNDQFTLWRSNGLRMNELSNGHVLFGSNNNPAFGMHFDELGKMAPISQAEALGAKLGSQAGQIDPMLSAAMRQVEVAADGSTRTMLTNGLTISEELNGSVKVIARDGRTPILTASTDGNILKHSSGNQLPWIERPLPLE